MKRLIYLLIVAILTSWNAHGQCLCSEIKFRLILPELKFYNNEANYSIEIVRTNPVIQEKEITLTRENTTGDTANFQFRTGGGIDTLLFVVSNKTKNLEMKITATHLTLDNPYYIDLTTFTEGDFMFDWRVIAKCQREHLSTAIIACEGKRIYQLQLKTDKEHFVHNKIRPVDINDFKQ